jgi:DNA-binding NarL/FixJ family response regulator
VSTGQKNGCEASDPGRIRVLLCDDHTLFREGIRAMLVREPDIEIVGEADDGKKAVEAAQRLRPDVILMDVSMPNLIGYEAIRQIVAESNLSARVVVLTMYEEEEIIRRCLGAGASGFVAKDAPGTELMEAVRRAYSGERYLSSGVLKKVINEYREGSSQKQTKYDSLSAREREVLKLLADGRSVKEIASRLDLSVKTAEAHKYNLMRKLDLHDRTDIIKYALGMRLITVFPFS